MATNYGSNRDLIKGAADAYKNYDNMPGMYQGLDELVDAGLQQSKKAIEDLDKKKKENDDLIKDFEKNANKTIQQAGSLSDVIYNDTYEKVNALKVKAQAAISSDNDKEYQNVLREVSAISLEIQDHKATRNDIATLMTDPDVNYSKSMLENGGDEMFYINQILANKYSSSDKDGQKVYNLKDRDGKTVSFTNAELQAMYIPENVGFQLGYGKASIQAKKDEIWDGDTFRSSIRDSIGKTLPELRSAIADGRGGLDIRKLLENDTNLDKEILDSISGWDTDGDSFVDPDEKANFIDAALNYQNKNFNEDTTRLIIEEKLTQAGKKKHAAYWAEKNKLSVDVDDEKTVRFKNWEHIGIKGETMTGPEANKMKNDIINQKQVTDNEGTTYDWKGDGWYNGDEKVADDNDGLVKELGILDERFFGIESSGENIKEDKFDYEKDFGFDFIKMNEEDAEVYLKEKLPKGFSFEQYGIGDAIKVKYGDDSVNINLQPNTTSGEKNNIKKLVNFIKKYQKNLG